MKWKIKDIEKAINLKIKRNYLSLGVDIALNLTGWALLETTKTELIFKNKGIIATNKYKVITDKLDIIKKDLDKIIITKTDKMGGVIEMPWLGFNPRGAIVLGISAGVAYNVIKDKMGYSFFRGASTARKIIGLKPEKGKRGIKKPQAQKYIKEIFKIDETQDIIDGFILALSNLIL